MQEALARSLSRADAPYEGHRTYYEYLKAKYTKKRDMLASALSDAGFIVPDYDETPGGGFFIFARAGPEIQQLVPKRYLGVDNNAARGQVTRMDWALCQWLAEEIGILCIPSSPFFSLDQVEQGVSDPFIRVAFCKSDDTIQAAAAALQRIKGSSRSSISTTMNGELVVNGGSKNKES
jgi:kynurenine--oxoglutarate transaminase/cysteine-S-conjugate beta-lyase/glutamine--phenylpyruvate transaminase